MLGSLVVGALWATSVAGPAAALDPDEKRARVLREIARSQDALEDLSAEAKQAVLTLRQTQAQFKATQVALAAAQARLEAARARALALQAQLAQAKADEARAEAELAEIRARIEVGLGVRNNMARQAYEGAGQERLALLLAGGTAIELSERLYLIEKANDSQNVLLRDLGVAEEEATATLQRLAEARRRIAILTQQAAENLTEAQAAEAAQEKAKAELLRLAAVQQAQVTKTEAARAGEAKRLATLQAESDRLAALLRARSQSRSVRSGRTMAPPQGGGSLGLPVNAPITSPFGMRFHPILHYSRLHTGIDFGAECGAPVYAAASGNVVRAGWSGGYGNQIVVEHGGSLATTYNHLSSIGVSSGSVRRGEVIGQVGTTGLSTGCHLHFEVRINGDPVNPAGYL